MVVIVEPKQPEEQPASSGEETPSKNDVESRWSVLRQRKTTSKITNAVKPKKYRNQTIIYGVLLIGFGLAIEYDFLVSSRVIELSANKAAEMFGYQSKLANTDGMIFTAQYSESGEEDSRSLSSGNT